jgi:PadR family transcriptional regulator AphA
MRIATASEIALSPQPVLLGFLMLGPRHPYELHREFERELGRVWQLGRGHLYAHLKQLAQSGLATVEVEAQKNRPARNIYRIKEAGKNAFMEWMHTPSSHARNIRLEFLARLYFHRRLSLPGLDRLVSDQKALLESRIESFESAAAKTEDEFWSLVLDFRVSEMRAIVSWLDRSVGAK